MITPAPNIEPYHHPQRNDVAWLAWSMVVLLGGFGLWWAIVTKPSDVFKEVKQLQLEVYDMHQDIDQLKDKIYGTDTTDGGG